MKSVLKDIVGHLTEQINPSGDHLYLLFNEGAVFIGHALNVQKAIDKHIDILQPDNYCYVYKHYGFLSQSLKSKFGKGWIEYTRGIKSFVDHALIKRHPETLKGKTRYGYDNIEPRTPYGDITHMEAIRLSDIRIQQSKK